MDLQCCSKFVTLNFKLINSAENRRVDEVILIATTRPELLPACVAVFVHPEDKRYTHLVGEKTEVPIFKQRVPILTDPLADPDKGTGIVMCCTFGDQTDIIWWQKHNLPLLDMIGLDGLMTEGAGILAGLSTYEARQITIKHLTDNGFLESQTKVTQSVRVHERCDTPVEYISNKQWFIRLLDHRDEFLKAGEKVNWYPEQMKNRYRAWVENLSWDWCISRQRYYGVAFPLWYCEDCDEIMIADEGTLPVDPILDRPGISCKRCGGTSFKPETDVMDTWATSSISPQIAGGWMDNPQLYEMVYPFTLRPQAHEIIRTWAFYTIVKSKFHFDVIPWRDALISGWGITGDGGGKISKSRGGGPIPPVEMIDKYSGDAVRYWAASTGAGKDAIISEEKIQIGSKLVNKIWNVSRFSYKFLNGYTLSPCDNQPELSPADRWVLSQTQGLIQVVTTHFSNYDYAAAKSETEAFFWIFADNYLEMAKQRLYDLESNLREGAKFTLYHVLLTLIKLFAPILPYVTECIFQAIFAKNGAVENAPKKESIHISKWPVPNDHWIDEAANDIGETLLDIARQVRRYKSENNLSLATEISKVKLVVGNVALASGINAALPDLHSITRATNIEVDIALQMQHDPIQSGRDFHLVITR
jgi:valyl-tRNA synthetase